ncbi:MAG TPA: hypothetical protein VF251_15905 [Pyrinomonadaceae bacterium]
MRQPMSDIASACRAMLMIQAPMSLILLKPDDKLKHIGHPLTHLIKVQCYDQGLMAVSNGYASF